MTNKYTDKELRNISEIQYKDLKPGQEVTFEDDRGNNIRVGYLYDTIDNRATGLYTYIVTDRPVLSSADFDQVKNVHVFYRGSVGPLTFLTDT